MADLVRFDFLAVNPDRIYAVHAVLAQNSSAANEVHFYLDSEERPVAIKYKQHRAETNDIWQAIKAGALPGVRAFGEWALRLDRISCIEFLPPTSTEHEQAVAHFVIEGREPFTVTLPRTTAVSLRGSVAEPQMNRQPAQGADVSRAPA